MVKEEESVCVPNFISADIIQGLVKEVENYKWWSYAILPYNNVWTPEYFYNTPFGDADLQNALSECNKHLSDKQFAYRFRRQKVDHYNDCVCVTCKLYETLSSFLVISALCKITGYKNLTPREIFLSNYSKGDVLTIHHDKNKGDIAVTFCFTRDWHPVYGGILHFCDSDNNIYKSVIPTLGAICIFKLDKNNIRNHFVSKINVPKNRYMISAWYDIVE